MEEIWKDVVGYEGLYKVSNLGRVKSMNYHRSGKEKILKTDKSRYERVPLCKNGKETTETVHKLVAMAFIPNPYNLPQVNHKDENKLNNNVENLEWCTQSYNNAYGKRTDKCKDAMLKKPTTKSIAQYTLDLPCELIKVWPSASEIYRELGFHRRHVVNCCKGRLKQAYGYQWSYWED